MSNKIFKSAILSMVILFISVSLHAVELKTAAQESAPKYFKSDGNMQGLCVDTMKAIEEVDSNLKFTGYENFLPFKRLQLYLYKSQLDIFFGFKKTDKRKAKYTFIDTPLYTVQYMVAVRIDDDVNINSIDDIRALGSNGKILTTFGSATSRFLNKQGGLTVDDGAQTTSLLLKKLIGKRGRFAFYHNLGLTTVIRNDNLSDKVKILPVSFLTYDHYAAVSQTIPASTVNQINDALKKLSDNGELKKIHIKYNIGK